MKNARKAGSVAGKKVCINTVATNSAKAKNGKKGAAADAMPFAHRTPTQLHASTYVINRG